MSRYKGGSDPVNGDKFTILETIIWIPDPTPRINHIARRRHADDQQLKEETEPPANLVHRVSSPEATGKRVSICGAATLVVLRPTS